VPAAAIADAKATAEPAAPVAAAVADPVAAAAPAEATQVIRLPAADGSAATPVVPSGEPTQIVPPPPPIDRLDGSDSAPDESPTDVAVELTGRGTPVDPAADSATEPARRAEAGIDDTARARRG
jgi:hypothetical protein